MSAAIRYVPAAKYPAAGILILQCRVKPGASRVRDGVVAVTDGAVEICVAAHARDGEANKAVVQVLSQVTTSCSLPISLERHEWHLTVKILGVPKSSVSVTRGTRSRDKTLSVTGMLETGTEYGQVLDRVFKLLSNAAA
ncbi:yggU family protein [Sporothrix schenckii 1099-18]|uniref:YggU family protein n=1 Tax=Sporothrix schenckii 1099-18 TaxID=1397361 RepID=A0A0F2MEY5_SPOSC|nr:yggU family protein [Sporothrix schenckii 1099-18]KJR87410.1 yggU family protein [Sporothrix schenckii 1099-18]